MHVFPSYAYASVYSIYCMSAIVSVVRLMRRLICTLHNSNTNIFELFNLPGGTLECLKWGLRVKTTFVKMNFVVTKMYF